MKKTKKETISEEKYTKSQIVNSKSILVIEIY